ncbi:aminotransferase class IV [Actinomadura kijaniata]|uniref:aminotransferase class IV n=1 Tax=Actinomadura kijaniata TaxID=46161 RepID=UPI00083762FE|nr:aminotransferase class IV [Actinomadura kijaniata]
MDARTEIDGRAPTVADLLVPALVNHGHLTVMQVRDRAVRGLDLHLARLDAANRELFGVPLDGERVRRLVRHALADDRDATVRVNVFRRDGGDTAVMVTVREPHRAPTAPRALRPVAYRRPFAHLKHTGSFAQLQHMALAQRDGFDDVLLTDPDGVVSETGIANLLVHDGETFAWPDAPALPGITMLLLERAGIGARRRTVHLADLPGCAAAFVTNSSGVSPVGRVGDAPIPRDTGIAEHLDAVYASIPWDAL